MAVFTELSESDAAELADAHGLGRVSGVEGVPAGSVNSNFLLETERGRWFARVYEEQDADGVDFEWALLAHLRASGVAVPQRVPGPPPGALRIAGKPTAVFELVGGTEICQRLVTPARLRALGEVLGRAHLAVRSFPNRRRGRFTLDHILQRLEGIDVRVHTELAPLVTRLSATLEEVRPVLERAEHDGVTPKGIVHGDLFRDNVRWDGDQILAVLDWESASDGLLVYDLAVTILAWCFDDVMRWDFARILLDGYESVRTLERCERELLRTSMRAAAVRFCTTRLTDYHLRQSVGPRVIKDFRRFVARLDAVEAVSAQALFA